MHRRLGSNGLFDTMGTKTKEGVLLRRLSNNTLAVRPARTSLRQNHAIFILGRFTGTHELGRGGPGFDLFSLAKPDHCPLRKADVKTTFHLHEVVWLCQTRFHHQRVTIGG